jgi:cell division protein FtsW
MSRKILYDRSYILTVLALLAFGLVMVFSASGIASLRLHESFTWIFVRQLAFVFLGLIMMLVAMQVDYHLYADRRFVYGSVILALILLSLVFAFPAFNGARRWILLFGMRFQPSEFAKLVLIIFTAYYIVNWSERLNLFWKGLLPYLAVLASIVVLILLEPDLGTGICIVVTSGFLLYLGGLNYRYLWGAALIAIPAFYKLVLDVPYRRDRVLAFLNPEQDPLGAGYHIRQSLIAIGSGGWEGLGYAQGTQKQFFLPEPQNDFIFAVIGEELGLWGTLLVLLLFAFLFRRGTRIALRSDSPFGVYLGLGIVAMISIQALINMSVVVSLLPTKGLPLPFISAGGSSMMAMLTGVGILLNISKQAQKETTAGLFLSEVEEVR